MASDNQQSLSASLSGRLQDLNKQLAARRFSTIDLDFDPQTIVTKLISILHQIIYSIREQGQQTAVIPSKSSTELEIIRVAIIEEQNTEKEAFRLMQVMDNQRRSNIEFRKRNQSGNEDGIMEKDVDNQMEMIIKKEQINSSSGNVTDSINSDEDQLLNDILNDSAVDEEASLNRELEAFLQALLLVKKEKESFAKEKQAFEHAVCYYTFYTPSSNCVLHYSINGQWSIRYGRIQYAGTLTIDFNSETVTFKQNVNLIRRITTKNTSHNNRSIMLRDVVSIEAYKIVRPPQEEALIQTKVILSSEKDTPGEKEHEILNINILIIIIFIISYINVSGGGFCPQSSFVFLKTHWLKWKKNTEVGREQVGKCKEDEEILLLNAGIISSDTDKYISRRVLYQERGSSLFEQGSSALLAVDDTH
ncbi:MAG: hypothetical protein EZS28_000623 [Streblomastix strix]|uniref:Uncharacterized protein n=1 Tax=Streblomastix strix TaxID=222440 RepID=A0A5J4X9B4_9EUKA|nr:MAG: hypothetical protein EZS28_000623 [Streblomastix strix]